MSINMEAIYHLRELQDKIADQKGVLIYFSSEACSVCKVLRPKVKELLKKHFPRMTALYVDIEKSPVISGQFRVFTIPTILIYFDGKEQVRYSRNISMQQLEQSLSRPYQLVFED
ncbi:MAG: thioredoxin family protein [Bacteroidales bacterium]|nr:thioredoxin family protein [Bacteroidales bacterium]